MSIPEVSTILTPTQHDDVVPLLPFLKQVLARSPERVLGTSLIEAMNRRLTVLEKMARDTITELLGLVLDNTYKTTKPRFLSSPKTS